MAWFWAGCGVTVAVAVAGAATRLRPLPAGVSFLLGLLALLLYLNLVFSNTRSLLHLTTVPAAAQTPNSISQTGAVATDNIQSGKQGFVRYNCSVCHGSQGQGAAQSGPRIAPPGPSFTDFVRQVRQPAGNMPPVSSQRVPDVDLADIYAFLQSVKQPPAVKEIPLLNK